MNSELKISIIIPVYNEEKRITRSLKRILNYCIEKEWNFEIIVAEDGSTDNTVKIAKEFQSIDERIKILSSQNRLGKGGAIKNAIFHASKEYVCFMDVDLSADIAELERLIPFIKDYDIVIGSRLIRDDLTPIKGPIYRKIFSHFYSSFFRFVFHMPIHDPQCGFKLFIKNNVLSLFNEIHTTGFAFDTEVLVKAYWLDLTIKEVPIIWNYDNATKVSVFKQIRAMGNDLLSIWYEAHLLWLQNIPTYPQKKGSVKARILFSMLSLFKKPRE